MIGFIELYNGFPSENNYYIGSLYIENKYQGQDFGKELIKSIINEVTCRGFKSLSLGVELKNWQAIRLWYSLGFNKITRIYGDNVIAENKFMSMELENVF